MIDLSAARQRVNQKSEDNILNWHHELPYELKEVLRYTTAAKDGGNNFNGPC